MHLHNPYNENKPVKISRDGQEIDPAVGHQLACLFDEGYAANPEQSLKRRKHVEEPEPPPPGKRPRGGERDFGAPGSGGPAERGQQMWGGGYGGGHPQQQQQQYGCVGQAPRTRAPLASRHHSHRWARTDALPRARTPAQGGPRRRQGRHGRRRRRSRWT
jgi:hypothetical protein